MEGILDRRSARLSRGPRGTGLGGLPTNARCSMKREPGRAGRRRRQGCQRRSVSGFSQRKNLRLSRAPAGRRSESPVVKRVSPQPRSYRLAPSWPVLVSARPRTGEHGTRRETFAGTSTEPQGFGTRMVLVRCRKASCGSAIALGSDEVRVLELERFRSANVDRTHRRARRPRDATKRTPRTRAA